MKINGVNVDSTVGAYKSPFYKDGNNDYSTMMDSTAKGFQSNLMNNINNRLGFPDSKRKLRAVFKVLTGLTEDAQTQMIMDSTGLRLADDATLKSNKGIVTDKNGAKIAAVRTVYNKMVGWQENIGKHIEAAVKEHQSEIANEGFSWQNLQDKVIEETIPRLKREMGQNTDFWPLLQIVMKEWSSALPAIMRGGSMSGGRGMKRRRSHRRRR
jgi:hypothetical protein